MDRKMNNEEFETVLNRSRNYIGDVYFNSFGVGVSSTDIAVMIISGGSETGRLIMPFETAKSLSIALADSIKKVENKLGHINSLEEVMEKLKDL